MKKLTALVLCIVMVFALAACGGGGEKTALSFGTGGDQGTYYGFGSVLSQYVSANTDVSVTAVTSGGSQANIEDLTAGNVQLGFVQSDVMSYAFNGTNLFEEPVTGFSVVAALYMEQVQIITLNPEIVSVSDLVGKTVSVGAAGSGVYYNALDILGAYDITLDDITPVYQNFGDSAESLQDGKIDAAFIVAGAPTTAVSSLAATSSVYLVSIDDEHVAALIEKSPYYSAYTIAADVYGTPEDVSTVAIGAVIIADDKVSEDAIYAFVSSIFENQKTIAESHAKGNEMSLEFATSITDVPYHPGAAKYFAEKEITVPVK
ncbi:MAG: TAXI family TRAP transporter solute-binding subunit [Oscillospiraceae bacterium]